MIIEKTEKEIIAQLIELRAKAYAPYSNFHVACIIQSQQGEYHYGCNVENVAYPLAQCAEATAISQMIVAGSSQIKQVWILATDNVVCAPCGACRQKLFEFSDETVLVHLCTEDGVARSHLMHDLLPDAFHRNLLLRGDHECC